MGVPVFSRDRSRSAGNVTPAKLSCYSSKKTDMSECLLGFLGYVWKMVCQKRYKMFDLVGHV